MDKVQIDLVALLAKVTPAIVRQYIGIQEESERLYWEEDDATENEGLQESA